MLRMHGRPAAAKANADRTPVPGPATDRPLFPVPERLADVQPVAAEPVRNAGEGRLWNEFVARYHYLGYSTLPGAQMRYLVRAAGGEPLAVLGFGAAAWKIAPRDELVEPRDPPPHRWRSTMPGPCPGSKISRPLALVERRLPDDWERRYAPVLLETFCETPRFEGNCYRAASKVGKTQGRGSTRKERALPVKDAEAPAAGLEEEPQQIDRHPATERLPRNGSVRPAVRG